ncbi:MAG: Ig-like domain-containing protein [Lachnospiraceae bacterium]|nr:Ig-like domain-containing protein [Lachnospiraceae bacterium]
MGKDNEKDNFEWDHAVPTGTWELNTEEIEKSIIDATLMQDENLFIEAAKKEQREKKAAVDEVVKKLEDVSTGADEVDQARIRKEVNQKIIIRSEELKEQKAAKKGRKKPFGKEKKASLHKEQADESSDRSRDPATAKSSEPSDFRKRSADWKEEGAFSGGNGQRDGGNGGFASGLKRITGLQWAIGVLAVVIFITGIRTTAVYADYKSQQIRVSALEALGDYVEADAEEILQDVREEEVPALAEEPEEEELKVLSLVLTSVEKDLKIKLVDQDETLVRNLPWGVMVSDDKGNEAEEEDDDEDGVIHLTDMSAGDYSVEIKPNDALAGYILPSERQTCSVKATVEYKVIANIKDEIKTEKEVNAAAEDANGNQAADVETGTAPTDTVEWCESTKTANGEAYVEAVVDLTKTAALDKKESPLLAFLENIGRSARTAFSRNRIAATPIFLSDIQETVPGDESGSTENPGSSTENPGSSTENPGSSTENPGSSTENPGSSTENPGSSTENPGSSTEKPGSSTENPGSSTENPGSSTENPGGNSSSAPTATPTPTSTPTPTPTPTPAPSESGTLSLSGYASTAAGSSATIKASVTPEGSTVLWTSSDTAIAMVSASSDTLTATVTGVKPGTVKISASASNGGSAEVTFTVTEQYAETAQLYDAEKNALYVQENGEYRLAKYADYVRDSSQKFYKKTDDFLYTGWQTIDGCTYYYKSDHTYVTGDQIIQGVTYHFDVNGVLAQGSGTLGIDVSKYQPSINWASVKASGINFVIIRCGYRGASTGVLIQDPYYVSHIKGAKAAGLKVGIYFFSTALNEAEAVEEASMCVALASGYGVNYPIFIDVESSPRAGYNGLSVSDRTNNITAFCKTIRSAGYAAGVYANKNWFSEKINASALSGYKIWLAQYNAGGPTYNGHYDLWQYTSKGSVNGISGNVDMNQSYLGY